MLRFPIPRALEATGGTIEVHVEDKIRLPEDSDCRLVSLVEGDLRLNRAGQLVHVQGELTFTLECDCAKCLQPFRLSQRVRVQEECPPTHYEEGKYERPDESYWTELEEELPLFIGQHVDLTDIITEYVLLSVPPYPACSSECKGLCGQCGANLNEGDCGCTPLQSESPFAALRDLLDEESKQN